ncbi:unnamed protein product [Acidithrix sp. C25]|nr:unnamed protein product [Acidithrix sp. C25]
MRRPLIRFINGPVINVEIVQAAGYCQVDCSERSYQRITARNPD